MKTHQLSSIYTSAAKSLTIRPLGLDDIADAIELISIIKSSGCLAKPHHLKERTFEQFAAIVNNGYALLGARNEDGQLIAFTSVSPTLNDDTSMTIRALSVHPSYTGNGLGKNLIQSALEWAFQNGDLKILARVATDNLPSLNSFKRSGFSPIELSWDADDKYWYYILAHIEATPAHLLSERPIFEQKPC